MIGHDPCPEGHLCACDGCSAGRSALLDQLLAEAEDPATPPERIKEIVVYHLRLIIELERSIQHQTARQ